MDEKTNKEMEKYQEAIDKFLMPNLTNKPWGYERIIEQTDVHVIKEIHVKRGCRLSLQYHEKKIEHMTLVTGTGLLHLGHDGSVIVMEKYRPYLIRPGTIHRLEASDDEVMGGCLVIEISSTELDDVVRLEDDYGREADEKGTA